MTTCRMLGLKNTIECQESSVIVNCAHNKKIAYNRKTCLAVAAKDGRREKRWRALL